MFLVKMTEMSKPLGLDRVFSQEISEKCQKSGVLWTRLWTTFRTPLVFHVFSGKYPNFWKITKIRKKHGKTRESLHPDPYHGDHPLIDRPVPPPCPRVPPPRAHHRLPGQHGVSRCLRGWTPFARLLSDTVRNLKYGNGQKPPLFNAQNGPCQNCTF